MPTVPLVLRRNTPKEHNEIYLKNIFNPQNTFGAIWIPQEFFPQGSVVPYEILRRSQEQCPGIGPWPLCEEFTIRGLYVTDPGYRRRPSVVNENQGQLSRGIVASRNPVKPVTGGTKETDTYPALLNVDCAALYTVERVSKRETPACFAEFLFGKFLDGRPESRYSYTDQKGTEAGEFARGNALAFSSRVFYGKRCVSMSGEPAAANPGRATRRHWNRTRRETGERRIFSSPRPQLRLRNRTILFRSKWT